MGSTIRVAGGDPEQIAWAREHGFEAADLSREITFNDDGSITLHRFVRDIDGQRVIDVTADAWLTEPVTVTPQRQFPPYDEVTGQ